MIQIWNSTKITTSLQRNALLGAACVVAGRTRKKHEKEQQIQITSLQSTLQAKQKQEIKTIQAFQKTHLEFVQTCKKINDTYMQVLKDMNPNSTKQLLFHFTEGLRLSGNHMTQIF